MAKHKYTYWERVFFAFDIFLNVLMLGSYNETISSRCGKGLIYGGTPWIYLAPVIDKLFTLPMIPKKYRHPNHCITYIDWTVGASRDEIRQRWHTAIKSEGMDFKGLVLYFDLFDDNQ